MHSGPGPDHPEHWWMVVKNQAQSLAWPPQLEEVSGSCLGPQADSVIPGRCDVMVTSQFPTPAKVNRRVSDECLSLALSPEASGYQVPQILQAT